MAQQLRQVLASAGGVTITTYRVEYNAQVGYIRHIFDCTGV
jgi:hypothetical protein